MAYLNSMAEVGDYILGTIRRLERRGEIFEVDYDKVSIIIEERWRDLADIIDISGHKKGGKSLGQLSRNEILVLDTLIKNNCTDYIRSYTLNKITEELDVSYYTVRNIMLALNLADYVREGAKNGRALSYYITEKGIKEIKKLKGEEIS